MTPTSRYHPKCPTCKKPAVKKDNAFFPFCSERCRLIDLGQWLDGGSLDREGKLADRYQLLTFSGHNQKIGSSVTLAGRDTPSVPEPDSPENN